MERTRAATLDPALVALSDIVATEVRRARREIVAALLLGLTAFLLVVGPAPLDPTNIAWLSESDAATNYLGWAFFHASPWAWPPAANPGYGMDIAGSVMMADANPLLALPFKLLSPLLPAPFQYFGWWLLACFLLQALFARAIAARISPHGEQRLAVAMLFLFAPCFLIRIATPAVFHNTLCGQWQILAALWLYLSPGLGRRAICWAGLLVVAVLTHPYLLAMVAALWLADLLRELLAGERPLGAILGGAAAVALASAAAAGLSGVFWLQRPASPASEAGSNVHSYGEWGFGFFKSNLLSPFDPEGWSLLLPDLPSHPGEIEGFAYLGLGILLLVAVVPFLVRRALRRTPVGREHLPLALVLAGFGVFALTPNVGVGGDVFHLPWPDRLVGFGNLFRSSGRFAWPLVYCAMVAVCWAVASGMKRGPASALLIAAALVQIADTSAGWRSYGQVFDHPGSTWPTQLASPFWEQAGRRYRAVRLITPSSHSPVYRDLAAWAVAHGMKSDIVYLARVDAGAFDRLKRIRAAELHEGRLPRDTLWIGEAAQMPRTAGDLVARIDGLTVYAPGFASRASGPGATTGVRPRHRR